MPNLGVGRASSTASGWQSSSGGGAVYWRHGHAWETSPLLPHARLAGAGIAGGDGPAVPVGAMAVVPVQRAQGLDRADRGG